MSMIKLHEQNYLDALNVEYGNNFRGENGIYKTKVELGMEKMNKLARMRKRALITTEEYETRRNTLEKFMFWLCEAVRNDGFFYWDWLV